MKGRVSKIRVATLIVLGVFFLFALTVAIFFLPVFHTSNVEGEGLGLGIAIAAILTITLPISILSFILAAIYLIYFLIVLPLSLKMKHIPTWFKIIMMIFGGFVPGLILLFDRENFAEFETIEPADC